MAFESLLERLHLMLTQVVPPGTRRPGPAARLRLRESVSLPVTSGGSFDRFELDVCSWVVTSVCQPSSVPVLESYVGV